MAKSYGVGLVGVKQPDSWSVIAHVPALKMLEGKFHIAGVANTNLESSKREAENLGVSGAFENVEAMLASSDIDIVVVAVATPNHAAICEAAINAGKHVYCEWPLGASYEETKYLANLAERSGLVCVCGGQAGVHPTIRYISELLAEGYVGDLLFSTIVANGGSWSKETPRKYAYSMKDENGATLLSVPIGHTLVALDAVFGPVARVFADMSTRRKTTRIMETGEEIPIETPDNATIALTFQSGLPLAMQYRGGFNRSDGFHWEIIGTEGELVIRGEPFGAIEMIDLYVSSAKGDEREMHDLPVPPQLTGVSGLGIIPANVFRVYELMHADLESGSRRAPSFADAERIYRTMDAIKRSSTIGQRLTLV